jgi:hypothetical protein
LPFSAEPGFSAAASFGISVSTGFPFGLHQGIRIEVTGCSVLMIRKSNRSRRTFTTSGQWPMHLLAPGMVNAVSLYVEHGHGTFHSVHVESAQRVAVQARRTGVERVAHVSGIGADAISQSLYIQKRARLP